MQNENAETHRMIVARLDGGLPKGGTRQEYRRTRLRRQKNGDWHAKPFAHQDSARLKDACEANGFIVRPPNAEPLSHGAMIDVLLFPEPAGQF